MPYTTKEEVHNRKPLIGKAFPFDKFGGRATEVLIKKLHLPVRIAQYSAFECCYANVSIAFMCDSVVQVAVVPAKHSFEGILLVFALGEDVRLARIAHHLSVAA